MATKDAGTQEQKQPRIIDLTELPDGDGYRVVAQGETKKIVRESDGAVWDGTAFVEEPVLVQYCYCVIVLTTDLPTGKADIEKAIKKAKLNLVGVEAISSFVARPI